MAQKKEVDLSRRNLFVGTFRRLRGEMDQGRPQARSSETLPILEAANTAFAAGDFPQAAAKFKELLQKEPNNNDARRCLGCCLYREAKFVQAKVEFERVLRTNREDHEAWLYLGLTLARGGSPAKAASVWKNPSKLSCSSLMLRFFAEMTPTVTVCSSPKGFPIATTHSPTWVLSESPIFSTGSLLALIRMTARS